MRFFSNSLIIVVALVTKRNFREHSRHKLNPLCFLWAALHPCDSESLDIEAKGDGMWGYSSRLGGGRSDQLGPWI